MKGLAYRRWSINDSQNCFYGDLSIRMRLAVLHTRCLGLRKCSALLRVSLNFSLKLGIASLMGSTERLLRVFDEKRLPGT